MARRERIGSGQQKRGSETKGRSFRKGKCCFRLLVVVAVSVWIRERLWNKCICPPRNQSQTQEVGGKSLPKSLSCRMPSVCCGHSSCTDPSCWESRQDPFSPVTSTSSPRVEKRETEILPCDWVHENVTVIQGNRFLVGPGSRQGLLCAARTPVLCQGRGQGGGRGRRGSCLDLYNMNTSKRQRWGFLGCQML